MSGKKKALVVWGGWDGHTPKESAAVFVDWLKSQSYDPLVGRANPAEAHCGSQADPSVLVIEGLDERGHDPLVGRTNLAEAICGSPADIPRGQKTHAAS